MKIRKDRTRDRREQLLEAALALAATKGFDKMTVQDISRACGIAPGLIYHYFASKTDLLRAVIKRYSFLNELKGILKEAKGKDLRETFAIIAKGYWQTLEERKEFVLMAFSEMMHHPEVARMIGEIVRMGRSLLLRYLSALKKKGQIPPKAPTDLFVRIFFSSLIMMFVAQHRLMPRLVGVRFPKDLDQFVVLLIDGLLSSRKQAKRSPVRQKERKERSC
ncbi:MAG: TetR/AcrR family transcriptional regulator [Armatimonadetes bacterium]|nr:TetR/AcrR family transcriptional regulator [Armatimonadota bacterium]MDW8122826.1 TetR/AcrR family transcriptional regulator [Armatimonadota bacterium]